MPCLGLLLASHFWVVLGLCACARREIRFMAASWQKAERPAGVPQKQPTAHSSRMYSSLILRTFVGSETQDTGPKTRIPIADKVPAAFVLYRFYRVLCWVQLNPDWYLNFSSAQSQRAVERL